MATQDPYGQINEVTKLIEELREIKAKLEAELEQLRASVNSCHAKAFHVQKTEGGR